MHVHGWFQLDWCLGGYLCVRAVVSVWVVEVGELTRGKGGRSACGCKEVVVPADFRRYWGSVRSPLPKGGEDGREGNPSACSGDEKVDAGGGGWCMSGAALVRAWGRE